jgi:hypothetical protein
MTNPDRFAIIPLPDGPAPANAIAVGPLSMAMEYLPQSHARDKREQQAADLEARALLTVAVVNSRADAVIERERKVKAQADAAQAIMSDAIHRFADRVLELSHRLDRIERQQIADALAGLPDRDDPQGRSATEQLVATDYLPPSPLPPPHGDDREVETVLERERGDQGDLPTKLQRNAPAPPGNYAFHLDEPPRQVTQPTAISLTSCDALDRGNFLTRRDWKAAKRRNRAS